ncbi:MAG: PilZ domain-containing protein [Nitrospirae bacterium]|nr:PilZ domain-containing protein [Nitrospirota bacterium]NTW65159.1 PilZ domain-containing protein [Nitrospirota bacterium]
MALRSGETITYCMMPGMQRYGAIVQSVDNDAIVLHVPADSPAKLVPGQYVMISDASDDVDYYNEIIGREGNAVRLKRVWTGKRGYFRVDDRFPVIHKKMNVGEALPESRIYGGYGQEIAELETTDDTMNPRLWRMLVDINAKLGLILEHINVESEGLTKAERRAVNISASGIRFAVEHDDIGMGDLIEIKMLLPTNPAVGIVAHGKAVRVEKPVAGTTIVSLNFIGLTEEVRDAIIQYTLKRQRDIVRRYREQDQGA